MINLKERKYFYFTQNSLKTFKECPFKFKKRYIDNIKWEKSSLMDSKIEFGLDFHKIAERYFLDIPVFEESFKDNEMLYNAYINLTKHIPIEKQNKYFPEYTIRFAEGDVRLEANLDLLIVKPENCIEIWDFKTNADLKKGQKYLTSLQTRIYLYCVRKTLNNILGFSANCDKIKMVYFNPENNVEIAEVAYTEEMYRNDEEYISSLIEQVFNYDYTKFNREDYKKSCEYCEFNLFCNLKNDDTTEFAVEYNWNEIEEFM